MRNSNTCVMHLLFYTQQTPGYFTRGSIESAFPFEVKCIAFKIK